MPEEKISPKAPAPPAAPIVKPQKFPLCFSCSHLVRGEKFLSRVAAKGRILLVGEGDGVWMYGVNPGGVAGGGLSADDAYLDFKSNYRTVLQDLADDADGFAAFKSSVEAFFNGINVPAERDWNEAVRDVREKDLKLGNMKKVQNVQWSIDVSELPLAGEKKLEIEVSENTTKLSLVGSTAANNSERAAEKEVA